MMRWAVVWLFFCFGCLISSVTRAQDVNISVPKTSCNNGWTMDIQCDRSAHDVDAGGHISLTPDFMQSNSNLSTGYVFINKSIRMLDHNTREVTSFSGSFTFRITPTDTNSYENKSGDGIAFVMFANASYRGNSGGTLGVYQWQNPAKYGSLPGHQGTKTFCVEYDTYRNIGVDLNDNHVGVDLKSANSTVAVDAGTVGINLKGAYKITTWIDYDSTRSQLEVRIANATQLQAKPAKALISYNLDLSTVVDEFMHVGIAASTGGSTEIHELYALYFRTFGLPPPSPSPSAQPVATAGNDDSKSRRKMIVGVSTGVAVAASALVLLCFGYICFWRVKRSKRSLGDEFEFPDHELLDMPHRFTYKQLSVATNGFSQNSVLGEGATSSVYRGVISSTGMAVAVKKVANKTNQGETTFLAEIKVVSRLRHKNLVKLLGWCSDRMNFLLVYELMPNGSLDKPLFQGKGSEDVCLLTWTRRLAILRGVASAVAYLHGNSAEQVIHRDIKSSNVLLDQDFNARLGDFGLARLIEHSKNLATTQLAGTPGYIAPEAFQTYRCTDKTDVYAFGALCLELVCGRRPIDVSRPAEEQNLVNWVWNNRALGQILNVVDTRLATDRPHNDCEIEDVLLIGLLCSHPEPEERPSMRAVELYLEKHLSLPPVPLCRPTPIYSTSSERQLKESLALALAEAKSPPHFSSRSSMNVSGSIPSMSDSASRVHSAAISA